MPLWRIFHPENFFTTTEKNALARDITSLYTHILPAFYVNVFFVPLSSSSMYIGGEIKSNFVRFAVEHIARNFDGNTERMNQMMQRITTVAGPLMREKGAQWEVHVNETPFDLWTVQGVKPPQPGSEQEKLWKKENAVVPY